MDLDELLLATRLTFVQHERRAGRTSDSDTRLTALCAALSKSLYAAAYADPRVRALSTRARHALILVCHDVAHRGDALSIEEAAALGRVLGPTRGATLPHPTDELLSRQLVYVVPDADGRRVVWPFVVPPHVAFYVHYRHPEKTSHE